MLLTRFAALPMLFSLVAANCPAFAQQAGASACDIPLVAIQVDPQTHALDLATGFTVADFTADLDGHRVNVEAAALDTSPKRIVLAFDATRHVDKKQWALQFQLAEVLLSSGSSSDRFSVFVSPGTPPPFASADEARAALQRLATARPIIDEKRNPIYDSLLLAIKAFGTPRFGDSIVLIGFREDANSKTKPDYVMGALIQNGIRLHTIDITDSGDVLARTEIAIPGGLTVVDPDQARLFGMATKSGGSSRSVRRDRSLKDDPVVQRRLQVFYQGISRPYRLTLQLEGGAKPRKLEIAAVEEKKPGPTILFSYPKVFIRCPAPRANP